MEANEPLIKRTMSSKPSPQWSSIHSTHSYELSVSISLIMAIEENKMAKDGFSIIYKQTQLSLSKILSRTQINTAPVT